MQRQTLLRRQVPVCVRSCERMQEMFSRHRFATLLFMIQTPKGRPSSS